MKNIYFKTIKLLVLIAILGIFITQSNFLINLFSPKTTYAVGDLTVDWGIGSGNVGAIFTIANMAPGDDSSKVVKVKNDAVSARPVGVKGIETNETGNINEVLEIVIKKDGVPVYGEGSGTGVKTLNQFFTDSAGMDGVMLATQQPGNLTQYTFLVSFNEQAGNEYQNKTTTFNLQIGIAIPVPVACQQINFSSNTPIFGTSKSEIITGTSGNDLIFAFEGGDKVDGNGGDDCIVGGKGGDALSGGAGNDVILGEEDGDSLIGGTGNDVLFGNAGSDGLKGEAGNDMLYGGEGSDGLTGNDGNDTLIGEQGSDGATGGAGTDTCDAEAESSCEV